MTTTLEGAVNTVQAIQDQHEVALQQSLAQESLGYIPDVEVTREVVMPRIVTQEYMSAMGIRRQLHQRELAYLPGDDTKMVITGLKSRLYL